MIEHMLFNKFREISLIPRPPGKELAVREYAKRWAESLGFTHKTDTTGNLVIYVPGKDCKPNAPTIVLQAHMDMVCEKTPESNHNFDADPLQLLVDGDWLMAKDTSLGSDNGIGMAYAMIAAEGNFARPPLELLFTVEEETGMGGALGLSPNLLNGSMLINIDSEDEGKIIIGCASGRSRSFTKSFSIAAIDTDMAAFELAINNLLGGHSGMEIYKQNANANKLICGFLSSLYAKTKMQILSYKGGSAMNAIPRDASVVFSVEKTFAPKLYQLLGLYAKDMQQAYPQEDIKFTLRESAETLALDQANSATFLDLIMLLPHGVLRVEPYQAHSGVAAAPLAPPQTETSCNLGPVSLQNGKLYALTFIRSSKDAQGLLVVEQCGIIARHLGLDINIEEIDTSAWQPRWDSPLLQHVEKIYSAVFKQKPVAEVIHAGLECGLILGKYPNMDAVSIGPNAHGAHSPQERVSISSALRIWDLLKAILQSYA